MQQTNQSRQGTGGQGFAFVETVLVLAIIGLIAGVGVYVVRQQQNAARTAANTSVVATTPAASAPQGTSASIDQLTAQSTASELAASHSADSQFQAVATSDNSALTNLGGAYNESSF